MGKMNRREFIKNVSGVALLFQPVLYSVLSSCWRRNLGHDSKGPRIEDIIHNKDNYEYYSHLFETSVLAQYKDKGEQYINLIVDSCHDQEYYIPPEFVTAMVARESEFNPLAVSSVFAFGISQFMKNTAKGYGLKTYTDKKLLKLENNLHTLSRKRGGLNKKIHNEVNKISPSEDLDKDIEERNKLDKQIEESYNSALERIYGLIVRKSVSPLENYFLSKQEDVLAKVDFRNLLNQKDFSNADYVALLAEMMSTNSEFRKYMQNNVFNELDERFVPDKAVPAMLRMLSDNAIKIKETLSFDESSRLFSIASSYINSITNVLEYGGLPADDDTVQYARKIVADTFKIRKELEIINQMP